MKHLFIACCSLVFFLNLAPEETFADMKMYEWYPTFTTPKEYGFMYIIGGYFVLEDDSKLPIHDGYSPMGEWGSPSGIRLVGSEQKYLPKQLNITWFSVLENQAYQAECLFPFEKLKRAAQSGYSEDRPVGWVDVSFNRFITGIAPGGYVQVWSSATGTASVSLSYCQGNPVIVPFSKTRLGRGGGYFSWDEYVKAALEEYTAQELDSLKSYVFSVNPWRETYTKRYPYRIKVDGTCQKKAYVKLNTFGGEYYIFGAPKTLASEFNTHGAPSMLTVFTLSDRNDELHEEYYRIKFDEKEVTVALEKFTQINKGKYFELRAEVGDKKNYVNISLTDGENIYLFERTWMD